MKRILLTIATVLSAVLLLPLQSHAAEGEFTFTYDYPGAEHDYFGIQRIVVIDAAMLLNDPSLVGNKVVGISVDIPVKQGCECNPRASAWLTKKLQVDGEFNLPDTQETFGEIKNYGTEENPELRLDITFDEPYTLTEEGIYVGYSLDVLNCNVPGTGWTAKYPIVTVCNVNKKESFMVHVTKGTSTLPQKYPEWYDMGQEKNQALAMRVIMQGEVNENAASLEPLHTLYQAPETYGYVYTNVYNAGSSEISSISYSYTVADENGTIVTEPKTRDVTIDPPLRGQTGAYQTLDLPFKTPSETGKYHANITVDKVNGKPNDMNHVATLDMEVVPFLPHNRPLVEDHTGFWCGYCPRVYVILKQMHDKYGKEFIPITYHREDELQTIAPGEFPPTSDIPCVYINDRSENIDYTNVEKVWLNKRRELAPAEINVSLFWDNDDKTALRAESTVKFVYDDPDARYMLTYAMVEDDMSNLKWSQHNYLTNEEHEGDYWDLFCGKEYTVRGLVYDDVIVNFKDIYGIEGSLPSSITGGEEYKHEEVLYLSDATCKHEYGSQVGKNVIIDKDKLRIVAFIIDGKTGNICNAASTGYSGNIGNEDDPHVAVDVADADMIPVATEYYTIEGIRLDSMPDTGIVIKVDYLKNGKIRTQKLINSTFPGES